MWWRRQWLPLAITWTGAVAVEVTAATPRGGRAGTDGEGGRATGHGSGSEGGKNTASSFLSSSSPSSNPPSRCRHRPPQRSGHAATVEAAGVRLLLMARSAPVHHPEGPAAAAEDAIARSTRRREQGETRHWMWARGGGGDVWGRGGGPFATLVERRAVVQSLSLSLSWWRCSIKLSWRRQIYRSPG